MYSEFNYSDTITGKVHKKSLKKDILKVLPTALISIVDAQSKIKIANKRNELTVTETAQVFGVIQAHDSHAGEVQDAKDFKHVEINNYRDTIVDQDINFTNGVLYKNNAKRRGHMVALILEAQLDSDPNWVMDWFSIDGTNPELNLNEFIALSKMAATIEKAANKNAKTHKEAVDTLTEITEIQGYDYSSGW